ncbi:MAG: amidohydrolase family protein [Deltaproteobacteria bacterium]|nr:amidohydrolase family protein [Deltaproteobacteria bacterium]
MSLAHRDFSPAAQTPGGDAGGDLAHCIAVARGEEPADLVITGGQVVNVFSAEVHPADVAISGGRIVGFGSYVGRERIDARGRFIAPGFIDAHIHLESTLLTPAELARVIVPLGTTTVVADPHELANVLGLDGINYLLAASRDLPLSVFVRGFGLHAGALASTVAHDSHNLVVVGTNDGDMLAAARAVEQQQGGLVAVKDGAVRAALRLPIAGLMADTPLEHVLGALGRLLDAARQLGTTLSDPFMTISFLALPVIPALRLTDRGLVDVQRLCFVPLFGEN